MTRIIDTEIILAAMPGTQTQLVEKSKVSKTAIFRHVATLLTAKKCHIVGWVAAPRGGAPQAIYAAGEGADAVCKHSPMSEAQKSARYRRKARKDGTWDDRKARERAKYWADRAKTHPDPLVAMFFGMAHAAPQQQEVQ